MTESTRRRLEQEADRLSAIVDRKRVRAGQAEKEGKRAADRIVKRRWEQLEVAEGNLARARRRLEAVA